MSTTTRTAAPFIWYELLTTDTPAALAFYARLLGWTSTEMPGPDGPYTLVATPTANAGGVMALPKPALDAGARPMWQMYVGVDDIDAHTKRVKDAGGQVLMPPTDIATVGRFAMVTDPQGAPFTMMTPITSEPVPVIPPRATGHVGWRELHAGHGDQAFEFYSGMFGWTEAQAMDMGPMGTYHIFAAGAEPVGGMMTKMPDTPVPMWLFYFNVEGLDAAVDRVTGGGGKVLMAQHQVPTGDWIAVCADPQGAMFGLLATAR